MTIKIRSGHFSGTSKVFGNEADALAAVARGLAIDNALNAVRGLIASADLDLGDTVYTDNSTGTADDKIADLPEFGGPITATGTLGAQKASFDTSLGQVNNALSVLVAGTEALRSPLGLPALTYKGTVATPYTVPAVTKAVTGAAGSSAVSFASGSKALKELASDVRRVAAAMSEVFVALGQDRIACEISGPFKAGSLIGFTATAAAPTGGAGSLSKDDADAALTAIVDGIATLADQWNDFVAGGFEQSGLHVIAS